MIINNFVMIRMSIFPMKNNSPLIVDSYTMRIPFQIFSVSLEPKD